MVFEPEVASLNMGSINFKLCRGSRSVSASGSSNGRGPTSSASAGSIFVNTFTQDRDLSRAARAGERGTRFEFECYGRSATSTNLAHVVEKGLAEPPFFIQMIFGILGGIGTRRRQT